MTTALDNTAKLTRPQTGDSHAGQMDTFFRFTLAGADQAARSVLNSKEQFKVAEQSLPKTQIDGELKASDMAFTMAAMKKPSVSQKSMDQAWDNTIGKHVA